MWGWTADHDLDAGYGQEVGTGRGFLIEATKGTWLIGTASEHHRLYAYQLYNAQQVYISMSQIESPYDQPSPQAPAPWTPNAAFHDPTFSNCPTNDPKCFMQWALRIIGNDSTVINIYGSGCWVFFDSHASCGNNNVDNCQDSIVDVQTNSKDVVLYNLNVRAVRDLVTLNGKGVVPRTENQGSWGGVIAAYFGFGNN